MEFFIQQPKLLENITGKKISFIIVATTTTKFLGKTKK